MSQKLDVIYDNIEVLTKKENYLVLANEAIDLIMLLDVHKILPLHRGHMILKLLTFKHDEKNPFPSHDKLQADWDIASPTTIKNYFKDIVKSGLVFVEKGLYGLDKRKNTYNLQPFLDLLGCFVEAVRSGESVCIKTLVKEVLEGRKATRKASAGKEEKETPKLAESIENMLELVSEERKDVYVKNVLSAMKRLDEETILHTLTKIEKFFDESKGGSFNGYVSKVFKMASNGDKQRDEAKALENENKPKYGTSRKSVREEKKPNWFPEHKAKQEKINNESSEERETRLREIANKDEMEEIASEFTQQLFAEQHGYENFEDMENVSADYLGFLLSFQDKVEGTGSLKVEIYNMYHDEKLVLKAN